MKKVKAWKEEVIIPTYGTGKPERVPVFSEKRIYQGSSGVVYPNPVIEKISDEKKDKAYQGYYLENKYLKIMILPELGGRVQMAWDKIRKRHFIYYNQVIKPALVGLTGPWISGGIEFNWPQHHRPSTFEPIDACIVENPDGSCTVWVNEVEIMFRTKGMAGFTLYPDKAYLEVTGKMYNRTSFPQSFLWWANPAVKATDNYQSIFPPDVNSVFDHGRRDVSSFPIAKGTYYKVDYSPGTDISRYKNIPVPTSYMAVESKYNFIGGYEHDEQAGVLHVADWHVSPGKKQWTWGTSDFGQAWERNLTDKDGPYVEIMTGVFTDNQPDFAWIQPLEEKSFKQFFFPYSKAGVVKNATKEAAINAYIKNNNLFVIIYATAQYKNAQLIVTCNGKTLTKFIFNLSPSSVFEDSVKLKNNDSIDHFSFEVTDAKGNRLVDYFPEKDTEKEIPLPAQAPGHPKDIESNDLLYVNGMHIEQYRHATYSATDYYKEALSRDNGDIRNNNAMGLWLLRRGQFVKSEPYFRKAIKRLTMRDPNPYDGEPYYNLGWSLIMQGRYNEAFDVFYKSTWNDSLQHAAFFNLARIAARKLCFAEALELIEKSIIKNYNSHSVRHLYAALLRKSGKNAEALNFINESLQKDLFNYGCRFEKYLILSGQKKLKPANDELKTMKKLMRGSESNYIEYAIDYHHAGMYVEAIMLLQSLIEQKQDLSPMVYYYLGYFSQQVNNRDEALVYFKKAATQNPDYCFPNRIEDIIVLNAAMKHNPSDSKAPYYLGNLWYDKRQYNEAIECWELSASTDPSFPIVKRNLSLALNNKKKNPEKAVMLMEEAFSLDTSSSRILMELDQLYKIMNKPDKERLQLLENNHGLITERDDLFIEYLTILNNKKEFDKVRSLLSSRIFHPWEGGEGKVIKQYLISHIEPAKKAILEKDYNHALNLLLRAEKYPENLGEGKLYGTQENDIHFLKGLALEGEGNNIDATTFYKKATIGISEPVQAIFYNDPQPDKIFYQALAWKKLQEAEKAKVIFNRFIEFGNQHLNDEIRIDYFAVSLPDLLVFEQNLDLKNKIHCIYLIGLGYLGIGRYDKASVYFDQVLTLDCGHQGATIHANMINFIKTVFNKE